MLTSTSCLKLSCLIILSFLHSLNVPIILLRKKFIHTFNRYTCLQWWIKKNLIFIFSVLIPNNNISIFLSLINSVLYFTVCTYIRSKESLKRAKNNFMNLLLFRRSICLYYTIYSLFVSREIVNINILYWIVLQIESVYRIFLYYGNYVGRECNEYVLQIYVYI